MNLKKPLCRSHVGEEACRVHTSRQKKCYKRLICLHHTVTKLTEKLEIFVEDTGLQKESPSPEPRISWKRIKREF